MKKKIYILLLVIAACSVQSIHGQHYFGVKGGYGMAYGRFYPAIYPSAPSLSIYEVPTWGLWSGGVMLKYYSHENYVGGVGAEIEFLQKAYAFKEGNIQSDSTYRRVYNSLFVPVIWQPHVNISNGKGRVFLNLGIGIGYHFPVSREFRVDREEGIYWTQEYHNMLVRDNPLTYGLIGGIGFNVAFGKFEFMAEGRYHFNFGDVIRNRTKYPGPADNPNRFVRSPVDAINISIGLYYRIGERPETFIPGAKAQQRRMKKIEKRNENAAKRLGKAGRQEVKPTGEPTVDTVTESLNNNDNGNDTATESGAPDTEGRQ